MVSTYIAGATPTDVFMGTCPKCVRPWRRVEDKRRGNYINGRCPDCLTEIKLERVFGTVSRMACDFRCMGAYGPNCECACGGWNHGGVWMETGEALASAIEKYQAEVTKREAKREAERQAKAKAARQEREDYHDDHATILDWLTATDWYSLDRPDGFLGSLREQYESGKQLSPRQLECLEQSKERHERWAAERAEREANATEVPEGRQHISGVVINVYEKDNPFSYNAPTTTCITVDCGTYRVSGTCPRSLIWGPEGEQLIARGHRVEFDAELKSGKEIGRGWFKRPTKAVFITA